MAVPCHKMVARTKPKCDSCTSAPPPSHGLLHPQKETPSEAPARVTSYLPLEKYAVWPLTAINDALDLVLCSAHPTLPPMNFSTLGMFSCSQFRLNFLLSPISFTWSNAQKLEAVFFLAAQPPPINTTAELTYSNFFPLSTSLIHEGFLKAYMQRQQIHFLSICKVTHWLVISGHKKKFLLFGWNLILSPGPSMYLLSFGSWKLTWLRTKKCQTGFSRGCYIHCERYFRLTQGNLYMVNTVQSASAIISVIATNADSWTEKSGSPHLYHRQSTLLQKCLVFIYRTGYVM